MSKSIMVAVAALLVLGSFTNDAAGGLYVGGKGGIMMVDVGSGDDPINVGIVVGYAMDPADWGTLAVEGEYTMSVVDGEVSGGGQSVKFDLSTLAVYAAYRSAGSVYGKLKVGFLREEMTILGTSGDDTGLSFGGGVGLCFGEALSAEVEYTLIEQDVSFISGGAIFMF